ncbi:hypothetical protein [Erythrobacter colymbi]|uniref:hypothetical protein n=1 Tax=Erythrobacter colymbi TaxID=1161202 RepID=UPI000A3A0B3C|nr:hypothetical protein [Erythrobacter colymbi]
MWPLPDQDDTNRLMAWQHDLIRTLRRGWRRLAIVLAALVVVALAINPSWHAAGQAALGIAVLLAFDLVFALAARLTLSFVERDKRP